MFSMKQQGGLTMKKTIITVTLVALLGLPLLAQQQEQDDPAERIKQVVNVMILLMENGHADEVLFRFATPEQIKKFNERKMLNKIAKRFKDGRYTKLLEALKKGQKVKPTFSKDNNTATLEIEGKDVVFIKIDGVWYLEN